MAEGRKMNPDLVSSARLQAEFRQAEILVTFSNSPMRPRLPASFGSHRHFLAVLGMPANDGLNLSFFRNLAPDNADIFP